MTFDATTFDALIDKIANDEEFRDELMSNPAAALTSAGVKDVTPLMVSAFQRLDYKDLAAVAHAFGYPYKADSAFT